MTEPAGETAPGYNEVPTEDPDIEQGGGGEGGEIEMTGKSTPGTMEDVPLDEPAGETAPGYNEVPTQDSDEGDDLSDLMDEVKQSQQEVTEVQSATEAGDEIGEASEEFESGADINIGDMPSGGYTEGVADASGGGDFDEDDEADAGDAAEAGEAEGLEEAAGEAEVAGGGPEDPFADLAAVGLMVAGAGVAIAGAVAGSSQGSNAKPAVGMPPSAKATILSGSSFTTFADALDKKMRNATGSTRNQLQLQLAQVEDANKNNRQITVYDESGVPEVGVQLSKTQLAQAILSYQRNPKIFENVSGARLQAMGLNPAMALGTRAGHTQSSTGIYYPVKSAVAGQPGANVYLNKALTGNLFNKQSELVNQATNSSGSSLHDNYVSNAQGVIMSQSNPKVKAYLTYQLQLYKYNNGMIASKPATVPNPSVVSPSATGQSAEAAVVSAKRKLQIAKTAIISQRTASTVKATAQQQGTIAQQQGVVTRNRMFNNLLTKIQGDISTFKTANPGKPVPSALTNNLVVVQRGLSANPVTPTVTAPVAPTVTPTVKSPVPVKQTTPAPIHTVPVTATAPTAPAK
jgi:hypothetical protein